MDWPTIILECGVSEMPRRLKADARWWFENSDGAVILVLLFFVSVRDKTIRIELWKRATVENLQPTRGNDGGEVTGPTLQRVINITPESVTGAPLKLKFEDIFLRKPKTKRGEANYTITEHDLRTYYNHVWPPVPEASSQDESSAEAESRAISASEGFVVD
ncbi:unnamed protein product [Tuber aestivum]|uniref:Uncharacterized protein n=1 Tax=Tuber aestivum TaxID=59557 RepID=A0A292PL05_9PEZI|nr:unnamed protein product [Tuber aestivum]